MAAIIEYPNPQFDTLPVGRAVDRATLVAVRGRSAHRAPRAVYRRRRAFAAFAVAVLLAAAVLAVTTAAMAASTVDAPVASGQYHVVGPGDTMWSIAADYAPPAERAGVVAGMVALNGGRSALGVGDVVALPVLGP